MRGLISHLRYTFRLLLKSPGFTVTAVLILGLGIRANTAIFSLVNGVLLKPLPYPKPDRLVDFYQSVPGFDRLSLNYLDYLDLERDQRSFDVLAAYKRDRFILTGQGEPEPIIGAYASGSLFSLLGRPFLLGTPFGETDRSNNLGNRSISVSSGGTTRLSIACATRDPDRRNPGAERVEARS